jgi:hypothetical protein
MATVPATRPMNKAVSTNKSTNARKVDRSDKGVSHCRMILRCGMSWSDGIGCEFSGEVCVVIKRGEQAENARHQLMGRV